jgi:hypothetical protein
MSYGKEIHPYSVHVHAHSHFIFTFKGKHEIFHMTCSFKNIFKNHYSKFIEPNSDTTYET